MTQVRTHPTLAGRRPARDALIRLSQAAETLQAPFDWRRALSLHRRLLSGDLAVIGDAARSETDTRPALAVLLAGVLAAGIGGWLWLVIGAGGGGVGASALRVLLFGTIASLAAWTLWLAAVGYALRSIFEIHVEPRRLLRAMAVTGGFAAWQFFLLAGPASFAVGLIATVGAVLLGVVAVRAGVPEADDRAAVISTAIGFGVYAVALAVLADLTGVASGVFVHAVG